jgi:hypothetical protein
VSYFICAVIVLRVKTAGSAARAKGAAKQKGKKRADHGARSYDVLGPVLLEKRQCAEFGGLVAL